jgi:bacteriorhodopsin
MGLIYVRENDALNINPPAGDQFLTENGSDWLWAATAVYAISFVSHPLRARRSTAEATEY